MGVFFNAVLLPPWTPESKQFIISGRPSGTGYEVKQTENLEKQGIM